MIKNKITQEKVIRTSCENEGVYIEMLIIKSLNIQII